MEGYVRVHPCRLVPHTEKYQSSSESESIIEPITLPRGSKETANISISEEKNVEEELETPSDHVKQHQTVRDGPTKQNPIWKTTELPKPGQTIEYKLANNDDSEWRKLNVISRAGKNKHLINVALEQGEPFWPDIVHGVLEWKVSKNQINKWWWTHLWWWGKQWFPPLSITWRQQKKNSKVGSKIKFTPKYLTKANPEYLQNVFILIKISMTNKSVKPDF